MKLAIPALAIALAAANVQAADISAHSGEDQALGARMFGVSWSWNGATFGFGSSSSSWGSSSASKSCYGATGKPWEQSGQPGWYKGNDGSCGNIPKWDNGDSRWCNNSRYMKSWFCKNGNPSGTIPKTSPWNWGVQGGHHGWPKPCTTGKPQQSTSQTSKAQQTTASTASSGKDSTSTAAPTSSAAPTTSGSGSTPTSTAPVVVPTGSPDPVCEDGYQQTYSNYTTVATSGVYTGQVVGATVRDNDHYLTYGLADTAEDCLSVCDNVANCVFVASYLDNEDDERDEPRHSGKYTCALYSQCVSSSQADNWGGVSSCNVARASDDVPETDILLSPLFVSQQNDPNYITDSSGWCKNGACN